MDLPSASCDILLSPTSPSIAFNVEICDYNGSSPSVPKRVQRRLLQTMETRSKSPVSLEDIEAKLKEADTRRQQFHEWLINKARPKARSPTQSPHPEDLAQRLEAKLVAAEQKRMELQAQEHMRLARLHEIRLAARNEVQLRAEREREELEIKVETRVQQAEMKRLALLEAEKQRRAVVQERMAQSLLQRSTLEDKDRERIEALRALICQRIAAAEEKRVGLLKAEQKRAQAVVLQARKVAKSVSRKREVELRSKKEELEARLQRAKRRRAEYLGQRGGCYGTCHNDRHKMRKHGDRLCRKLTMCWRQFRHSRKTTHGLVQEYGACDIDLRSVTSLPFEQLAARITSPSSLRSVKAVLGRIESRFMVSSGGPSNVAEIDHLLKRLAPPPNKKISSGTRVAKRKPQGPTKAVDVGKDPAKPLNAPLTSRVRNHQEKSEDTKELERYPARVFLCAYMIVGHPEAVFSSRGEREIMLSEAASRMLPEFEALISIISDGPSSSPSCSSSSSSIDRKEPFSLSLKPFSVQLAAFDGAWCAYLYQFVAWKVKDAQSLEEDLIRVACQLEVSMLQKCKGTSVEDGAGLSHDTQAIRKQVLEDQQLLRERVFHLTGAAGVTKMKEALLDSRAKFKEAKESGSPLPSPFSSPLASQPENFSLEKDEMGVTPRPKAARSLFTSPTPHTTGREMSMSEPTTTTTSTTTSLNPQDKELSNERLVNEMLHDDDWLPSNLESGIGRKIGGQLGDIQDQIKSTMEKAFWDGVIEGLLGDHPEYERIVDLFKEIRMELEGLVPQSWKQEIQESIDLELFSQILRSGAQDYDYFRKLLNYTLSIILKLGAPARDEEASAAHQKLFEELANISSGMGAQKENAFSYALVKGIRFVLEQLQVLKADISMARIQAMTPLIQGSSGVKYMRSAFSQRYQLALSIEDYLSVSQKLPKTARLMDEVIRNVEQERQEFESLRALLGNTTTGASFKPLQNVVPSTVLMRTGGKVTKEGPSKSTIPELPKPSTGNQHKVLEWNSIDVVVGLGLLNTICKPEPATEETEAETLLLNIHRIRKIQNSFQQIVVMATGLLLLRQDLVGKGTSGIELEKVLEGAGEQLNSLVNEPTVSMDRIGALLANLSSSSNLESGDRVGCIELFSRVLSRSLSPDDAVFKRVSAGVRASLKALLILGEGSSEGQCLSRLSMQRIGTNYLLHGMLLSMAQGLDKLVRATCQVHHPWYACLVGGRTPTLNPKPSRPPTL